MNDDEILMLTRVACRSDELSKKAHRFSKACPEGSLKHVVLGKLSQPVKEWILELGRIQFMGLLVSESIEHGEDIAHSDLEDAYYFYSRVEEEGMSNG